MLFQESWEEYVYFGIIFGATCLIDLILTKVMRRRQRQLQQRATARTKCEMVEPEPVETPATLNQEEELAKWEDIVLTTTDLKEKIIAIYQVGLMGNVDDIELLREHTNSDPTPQVQIAIKRAIEMLKAKIGQCTE